MANVSCFLTLKDNTTRKEYTDLFWSHATSKTVTGKGRTVTLEMTRSEFVDESKTSIYQNTRNEKELMINCSDVNMALMGKMMGAPEFVEMGNLMWDMNPATDVKIRYDEPTGVKSDLVAFATLKRGTSVDEYSKLFWSHATGTQLVCKGKTYTMPHSRGSMCNESRSAIYVNTKAPDQIAICCYDCDVAKLGAMMSGPEFTAMAEAMWTMTGMHFLASPQRPTLFAGTWKILDAARVPCMTYFASMTPADDAAEAKNVKLLGRWSDIGTATGVFLCEAQTADEVQDWLANWAPMATCTLTPICDDNTAREIILKHKPSYTVDYSHVGDEPFAGESLYYIKYKFFDGKKVEGQQTFANLTEAQDKGDSGRCRPLGRYHNLGMGMGFAIAAAKSEADLYAWANNWAGMCQVEFSTVLTDKQARKIISSKPGFAQKLATVKEQMGMQPKRKGWLW